MKNKQEETMDDQKDCKLSEKGIANLAATGIPEESKPKMSNQVSEYKPNRRERRRQAAIARRYRKAYRFTKDGKVEERYVYVFKKSISPDLARSR